MSQPDPGQVTQMLKAAHDGDKEVAAELLSILYDELRKLARAQMAKIPPGNTLQPTALVHEAYLRLADGPENGWNSRGHFFGAAAQAMRQILVDQARRKSSRKHGGDQSRENLEDVDLPVESPSDDILALDLALERLELEDPRKGQIVMLRYFAGLSREETAAALDLSVRTIDYEWRYIVARLHRDLSPGG